MIRDIRSTIIFFQSLENACHASVIIKDMVKFTGSRCFVAVVCGFLICDRSSRTGIFHYLVQRIETTLIGIRIEISSKKYRNLFSVDLLYFIYN